ncbi:SCO family protein [Brevibacillus ruminantium]|uniref:SCO family protein n=1 Tax=Brevibacillus ruminantium TaxID=2950604 RepID=A0ABY4WGL5_9BACL|nr:SCO family protein [Brevibacillus ruminantium]USG66300.1 SCO family protein [Brevibacillus ruminantium]
MSEISREQVSFWKRHWFTVAAGVLALLVVGVFGYQYMQKSQIPVLKQTNDFTLDSIDGSKYTMFEHNGKVRLVEFMFTHCPDICPATTFNMSKLQEKLKEKGTFGNKVEFVTITFDPERDTVDVLQKYAEQFNVDFSGWHFLRGEEADIEKVTKDYGMAVLKQPDGSFAHTARIFLIDKEGKMRRAYGMASDMDQDLILQEMSQLAK